MREIDKNLKEALNTDFEKYPSLNPNIVEDGTVIAKNSRFFSQMMEDGYVFNPYIHRRWLPRQYRKLLSDAGMPVLPRNFHQYIEVHFSNRYWLKFVDDELNKLINLNRYDVKAFKERSQFFTVDIIKKPYVDYVSGFSEQLQKPRSSFFMSIYIYAKCYSYYFLVPIKYLRTTRTADGTCIYQISNSYFDKLEDAKSRIENAMVYSEIKAGIEILDDLGVLKYFHNIPLNDDIKEELIYAYIKEGAYYTIKDSIMFRGGIFRELSGSEGCKELLRCVLDKEKSYGYFFDKCREMLMNGY